VCACFQDRYHAWKITRQGVIVSSANGAKRLQSNQLADVKWRAISEDRAPQVGPEGLKL
jgi:hypothetical protein